MNQQHLDGLEDITNCCNLELSEVIETYKDKYYTYFMRDIKNNVNIYMDTSYDKYEERAYKVLRNYAFRKLQYTENWIE